MFIAIKKQNCRIANRLEVWTRRDKSRHRQTDIVSTDANSTLRFSAIKRCMSRCCKQQTSETTRLLIRTSAARDGWINCMIAASTASRRHEGEAHEAAGGGVRWRDGLEAERDCGNEAAQSRVGFTAPRLGNRKTSRSFASLLSREK